MMINSVNNDSEMYKIYATLKEAKQAEVGGAGAGEAEAVSTPVTAAQEQVAAGTSVAPVDNQVNAAVVAGELEAQETEENAGVAAEGGESASQSAPTEGGSVVRTGGGSGGSEDEEEETTVTRTVVMADGSIVEKTITTDADGNTTVTTKTVSRGRGKAEEREAAQEPFPRESEAAERPTEDRMSGVDAAK